MEFVLAGFFLYASTLVLRTPIYWPTYCLVSLEEYHSPALVASGEIIPGMIELDS